MKYSELLKGEMEDFIDRLCREVRNETLAEIADMLNAQGEKIAHLIHSNESRRIYLNSHGVRFEHLHAQRQKCYDKKKLLWKIADQLLEMQKYR